MNVRDDAINARCTSEQKASYTRLAEQWGYDTLSEFVLTVLDSLVEDYGEGQYESHMLHVFEDTIVSVDEGALDGGVSSMATAAFPVVAPARFWAHARAHTGKEKA
jgi:hypothetical protein